MDGLAVTYTGFMSNQIKPSDPVFTYCSSSLKNSPLDIDFAALQDGFANYIDPSTYYDPSNTPPPPLDCIGSLTTNFKSPYNEKDIAGINGNYILSPCMYQPIAIGSSICESQPLSSTATNTPPTNPSKMKCDSGGDCSNGYQYSDGTPVTTQGKIFYTDIYYTQNKPDGSPSCRIIYFQACHTDGNEDDGMLILNPPCYGPNPDPGNIFGLQPGGYGYSMPNVPITDTQRLIDLYAPSWLGLPPTWTGARIVRSN
jgi:hypothetical protein